MQNTKTKSILNAFVESEGKEADWAEANTLLEQKIIKNFTDRLILKHLQKQPLVSGYEILNYLRRKFDVPFSPGTVYSAIYSLERHGLIKGDGNEHGRTYELTKEGGEMIDATLKARQRIQKLFLDII